ncbi:hypothetical protein BHE74_00031107, partial [Ensete ventricosum]
LSYILPAGSETEKLIGGDGSDAKMDAANEFLGNPSLREDQMQNAVKFLSHPKVRSSPVVHRRSFLEKKGLTKEEIDEAFRRVPDPPSTAATGEAYTTGPGNISWWQPFDINCFLLPRQSIVEILAYQAFCNSYAAEIIHDHAAPRSGRDSSTSSCSYQRSFRGSNPAAAKVSLVSCTSCSRGACFFRGWYCSSFQGTSGPFPHIADFDDCAKC